MKNLSGFILLLFMVLLLNVGCGEKSRTADKSKAATGDTSALSQPVKTILFLGNSLTAGYGVDPTESFPSLIQNKVDSMKLAYKIVNAGVSGETSSGGNARIDWILKQPVDIFILELGANDGLRGIPVTETKKNLQFIIDKVKTKYPAARLVITGMQIPPNMGQDYASKFRSVFPELAKQNDMLLVPFLLQGVGGIRELNQADGIHPTPEGHKIVAENVWSVIKGIL